MSNETPSTTQTPDKPVGKLQLLYKSIEEQIPEYQKILPKNVSVEKFVKAAKITIQSNPSLIDANRQSLHAALIKAAGSGLLIDGNDACVNVYSQKVVYTVMKNGLIKLGQKIGLIEAHVICKKHIEDGLFYAGSKNGIQTIEYRPILDCKPDDFKKENILGAYASILFKDGRFAYKYRAMHELESARKKSKAAEQGPWLTEFVRMCEKTAIRALGDYITTYSTDENIDNITEAFQVDYSTNAFDGMQNPVMDVIEPAEPKKSRIEQIVEDKDAQSTTQNEEVITSPSVIEEE